MKKLSKISSFKEDSDLQAMNSSTSSLKYSHICFSNNDSQYSNKKQKQKQQGSPILIKHRSQENMKVFRKMRRFLQISDKNQNDSKNLKSYLNSKGDKTYIFNKNSPTSSEKHFFLSKTRIIDNNKSQLKQTSSTYSSKLQFSDVFLNRKNCHQISAYLKKDNFQVLKTLGNGKFGKVYQVRQKKTGMVCAMKVIKKKTIMQGNFLEQFIRQLKIQMYVDHPNIIKSYGYFDDQQNFFTLMELGCHGQLYAHIQKKHIFSEQTVSFIIKQLLEALNYLHHLKIIHRDIKPENIVLVHGNIKLCDFGWTVYKKDQLRQTFCGTPLYLSPQLLNGKKYDQKVDIWAIGIMTYELAYGQSPFNIQQKEQMHKIITDKVKFPYKSSIQIQHFINLILQKNPQNRMKCSQLLKTKFIQQYKELQSCESLCK